jgi:hypothetical protein
MPTSGLPRHARPRQSGQAMNKGLAMTVGAGMGAGLMYLYDPQMGRRRARACDKLIRLGHRVDAAADVTSRDLTGCAVGVRAEMRPSVAREEVSDEVLAERARA